MTHSYFVSPDWLEAHLQDPNVRVVDASIFFDVDDEVMIQSGKKQFETHHIPGTVEANLMELSDPTAELPFTVMPHEYFVKALEKMGISDETQVVVYDSGPQVGVEFSASIWAARLAWQMLYAGLTKVSILEGGFDRWLLEGRPVSKEIVEYPEGQLNVQQQDQYFVDKKAVLAAIKADNIQIVDALSPDQYRGVSAPYGPDRAGHIPGSKNVFYGSLADPTTGRLLDREVLSQIFEEAGALDDTVETILYCGFGVGASWLFMVLKELGKEKIAVYDGSMDEWTQDDQLPIEKDSSL